MRIYSLCIFIEISKSVQFNSAKPPPPSLPFLSSQINPQIFLIIKKYSQYQPHSKLRTRKSNMRIHKYKFVFFSPLT